MKALVKYKSGPGFMELRDLPIPEVGDDDLLIKIKVAGVCGSDVHTRHGILSSAVDEENPRVMGHEFSGEICKVGQNVKNWKVGDRVVSDNSGYVCGECDQCRNGMFMYCESRKGLGYSSKNGGLNGGFAEYCLIPGQLLAIAPGSLFRIPDNLSYEEACMLDPAGNAYKAVAQESSLLPGQDVVIFGMGALGLMAVQIASIMGAANVIAVGRRKTETRFKLAEKYGATHFITTNTQNLYDSVMEITKGKKVPICFDFAGSNQVLKDSIDIVQNGGEIVRAGFDPSPIDFSLDVTVNRGINIIGHFAYNFEGLKNCLHLAEVGKLDMGSLVTHRFTLDDWESAFAAMESRDAAKSVFLFD